jgi:phage terminase large subunit-like protein
MLDRIATEAPEMARVVIGVDPSGTDGSDDEGDPVGIVAAGRGDRWARLFARRLYVQAVP